MFLLCFFKQIGSLLSIKGCCQYHNNKVGGDRCEEQDEEQPAPAEINNLSNAAKYIGPKDRMHPRQVAGFWGYVFQIMFQVKIRKHQYKIFLLIHMIHIKKYMYIYGV